MKSTSAKWIKKSDSSKVDYILNGTLTWNDHNLDIQDPPKPQGDRPRCNFSLNTRDSTNPNFTFKNYDWPDLLKDHSRVSDSQMTMRLNTSNIWNTAEISLDGDYYNFSSSYKKLDTTDGYILKGSKDYASFSF